MAIKSDGGSSDYYILPKHARDILDLIDHKNMRYPIANIFKACYRFGEKDGIDQRYDLNKMIFFAQRELERLDKEQANNEKSLGN